MNRDAPVFYCILLIVAALGLGAAGAFGEVGVSGTYNVYESGRVKPSEGVAIRAGGKIYAWASWEEPNVQGLGQNVYSTDLVGGGLGFRQNLTDRWRLAGEFGYFDPMEKIRADNIGREYATYVFRSDFGKPPFPVREYELNLKPAWGGRFLAEWEAQEHLTFYGGVRFLTVDENIDISSRPPEQRAFDCGCWWQLRSTLSFTSYVIGITGRF